MKDRTLTSAHAPTTAPMPMPGRLAVSYYSDLLKKRVDAPLSEVPTGAHVIATGTLTRVRYLDPINGRVTAILTGDDGHWAFVTFSANTVLRVKPLLVEGTRVLLVGHLTRDTPRFGAGIAVFNGVLHETPAADTAGDAVTYLAPVVAPVAGVKPAVA